jgi:hypothetical protein
VAASETARLDLYNGLTELLGSDRAETLMAALPIAEISDLATKADLALLGSRMDRLEGAMVGLGSRMDRLFLTLTAGLFVIVAAMVGMFLTVI